MVKIRVYDKQTGKTMYMNRKQTADLLGVPPSSMGHILNGRLYKGRWICTYDDVINLHIKRPMKDVDYRDIRRRMLCTISAENTQGIVAIEGKYNNVYYDIHLKHPTEELKKKLMDMVV